MNILLLGSGGREHALAWKMAQSPLLTRLFIAPGNAGTSKIGTNLPISPVNFDEIRQAVLHHKIDMVVVGPEDPLVNGIHDFVFVNKNLTANEEKEFSDFLRKRKSGVKAKRYLTKTVKPKKELA